MFLTLEELRTQIKIAKSDLIAAVKVWLDTKKESINQNERDNWLAAIQADNRYEMLGVLQERDLPLLCIDSMESMLPSSETSMNSEPKLLKSEYVVNSYEDRADFTEFSKLFTLMEQLHLLEELLIPIKALNTFDSLNLAHAMSLGINSEWRFVRAGVDTLKSYKGRLALARSEFEVAQQENFNALTALENQLNVNVMQFNKVLNFFAISLSDAFVLVKDERYWFKSIRPYLPWHQLINQLAINVFGSRGITRSNQNELIIQDSRVQAIGDLFAAENKPILDTLQTTHIEKCRAINAELKTIDFKLHAMAQRMTIDLNGQLAMSFWLPTQLLGSQGLFQRLAAAYGAQAFQLKKEPTLDVEVNLQTGNTLN